MIDIKSQELQGKLESDQTRLREPGFPVQRIVQHEATLKKPGMEGTPYLLRSSVDLVAGWRRQ